MNEELIITSLLLIIMIVSLMVDKMRPGISLFTIVTLMLSLGIISSEEALSGFSNPGMIKIGLLFLISEGMRRSGALSQVAKRLFPLKEHKLSVHLTRILLPVSAISSFLNNTPIVIIFAPLLKNWAEAMRIPAQKLLIPLSYATILGGMCTVIGTTTNLLINGMIFEEFGVGMTLFEVGKVGVPIALIGLLYIIAISRYLLPGSFEKNAVRQILKEYYYDVYIPKESTFIGRCCYKGEIEGLRDFKVVLILRKGESLDHKKKPITLLDHDELVLEGHSRGLQQLITHKSLVLKYLDGHAEPFRLSASTQVEAVLAPRFPGIGKTLQEFDFFRHYGATVMAIHRNGQRIAQGIDQVTLSEGDNLILLTDNQFIPAWGESSVFYLLSKTGEVTTPASSKKKVVAILLTLMMILATVFQEQVYQMIGLRVTMLKMAAITAVAMAWLNIFPARKYTSYISWDVIITIASALAISKGITNSGLASLIAHSAFENVFHLGPYALLGVLFIITVIFTELITNTAAAAITFPIAVELARYLQADPMPFIITICIASSASFLTPIGYQTNLIVQGIGNYRFQDYLKVGFPLTLIAFILSLLLIPYFWPF